MSDWVNNLIEKLEEAKNGLLEVEIGGQKVAAEIGKDLISFFKENKDMLIRVGKDTFTSFLILMSEKKNEQALNLLLGKMSADDIIARMKMNAVELEAHIKNQEAFMKAILAFTRQVALGVAAKVVIGLLIA